MFYPSNAFYSQELTEGYQLVYFVDLAFIFWMAFYSHKVFCGEECFHLRKYENLHFAQVCGYLPDQLIAWTLSLQCETWILSLQYQTWILSLQCETGIVSLQCQIWILSLPCHTWTLSLQCQTWILSLQYQTRILLLQCKTGILSLQCHLDPVTLVRLGSSPSKV
jgi:hypothetical protein